MRKDLLRQVREILDLQSQLLSQLTKLLTYLEVNSYEDISDQGFSIKEAAIRLGLGESTLRRLIKQGKIKATRIGGKIVIPAGEIRSLLRGKTDEA